MADEKPTKRKSRAKEKDAKAKATLAKLPWIEDLKQPEQPAPETQE